MGRFGNIARTDGTSRAARAIGRGPHRGRGSKVNANRAPSANPARMNFADSDPGSAAVCRERFRLALVGPEAAADADEAVQLGLPSYTVRESRSLWARRSAVAQSLSRDKLL